MFRPSVEKKHKNIINYRERTTQIMIHCQIFLRGLLWYALLKSFYCSPFPEHIKRNIATILLCEMLKNSKNSNSSLVLKLEEIVIKIIATAHRNNCISIES